MWLWLWWQICCYRTQGFILVVLVLLLPQYEYGGTRMQRTASTVAVGTLSIQSLTRSAAQYRTVQFDFSNEAKHSNSNSRKKKRPICTSTMTRTFIRFILHFTATATQRRTAAYVFVIAIVIICVLCCILFVLYSFLSSFHPLYYHTIIGLDGALYAWIGMFERGEDR